ncbi:phosphoesterase [Priestia endophytica]|nr:phosphoesterase [Priestia endophytica]RAS81915.1 phosphoesterase [Priestia endophytica]
MKNKVSNEIVKPIISDGIMAELFLNRAIKYCKKGKILEKIDRSLQKGDKEAFLHITEKLTSVS